MEEDVEANEFDALVEPREQVEDDLDVPQCEVSDESPSADNVSDQHVAELQELENESPVVDTPLSEPAQEHEDTEDVQREPGSEQSVDVSDRPQRDFEEL